MIEKAKEYAIYCHDMTAHQYDGKPYDTHLQMVFDTAKKFIHLIPAEQHENVLAACWVHDVIEDCRQTYNDVKNATNNEIYGMYESRIGKAFIDEASNHIRLNQKNVRFNRISIEIEEKSAHDFKLKDIIIEYKSRGRFVRKFLSKNVS